MYRKKWGFFSLLFFPSFLGGGKTLREKKREEESENRYINTYTHVVGLCTKELFPFSLLSPLPAEEKKTRVGGV